MRRRRFWGWGYEDEAADPERVDALVTALQAWLGDVALEPLAPPRIEEVSLAPPRVQPPPALAPLCTADPLERASHTYGKSTRDLVRALAHDFHVAPDWVARPRTEDD